MGVSSHLHLDGGQVSLGRMKSGCGVRSEWHLLKSKPFMLLTGSIPVALEDGHSCVYRLVLHVWAASVVV